MVSVFLGTWIGEILVVFKILIGEESLKFGTRMTRVCFDKTRMVTDSLKRRPMVADFWEHGLGEFEKSLSGFKFQVSGFKFLEHGLEKL
ncbi:hypothetical protein [Flavobacterium cucumis]|uniref:hypothetical protein n=1 Tax=Flavobacterium cucumis TaxID=416016 RepID=UPI000937AEA9|nr:hypothetical protein [Flavobacterium cucumis]